MSSTKKNVIYSQLGVVVNAVALFVVYKFVLIEFGPDKAGVWALLLSLTASAKLADLGLAAIIPKYIAEALAKRDSGKLKRTISTSFYSIILISVFFSIALYAMFEKLSKYIFPEEYLSLVSASFPIAILSFLLLTVATILLFVLDGYNKAYMRVRANIASVVIYIVFIVVMGSQLGFEGIIWAHVVQSLFLVLLSAFMLSKVSLINWTNLRYFSFKELKILMATSWKVQLAAVFSIFGENLVKLFIGTFSEIRFVVYYEMATKLISQVRLLAINACQLLVPLIASANTKSSNDSESKRLFVFSFESIALLSVIIYTSLIAMGPLISIVWLGELNHIFILSLLIMSITMAFNTILAPVYYANIASGAVSKNLQGVIIIAFVNLSLGWLLGHAFGYWGIVTAYSVAVILGTLYLLSRYFVKEAICIEDFQMISNKSQLILFLIPVGILVMSYLTNLSNTLFISLPMFVLFLVFMVFGFLNKCTISESWKKIRG